MDEDYVEGLTGEEIIGDIVDQVVNRLRGDCNLRETDSYTGGYDGTIEIHLNLRGLDTAKVKTSIVMSNVMKSQADGIADDAAVETVEANIEIPLEPHLNTVRERSGQDVPTLAKDDEGKTVVKKRHYAKPQLAGKN